MAEGIGRNFKAFGWSDAAGEGDQQVDGCDECRKRDLAMDGLRTQLRAIQAERIRMEQDLLALEAQNESLELEVDALRSQLQTCVPKAGQ